jgi:N-methylhydantoinase B
VRTKETGLEIRPGDRFLIESGGGGGWGEPRRRTEAARATDLESGFVTAPTKAGA